MKHNIKCIVTNQILSENNFLLVLYINIKTKTAAGAKERFFKTTNYIENALIEQKRKGIMKQKCNKFTILRIKYYCSNKL